MKHISVLFLILGLSQVSLSASGLDDFNKAVSKIGCNDAKQAKFKKAMDVGSLWKASKKDFTRWYSMDKKLLLTHCEAGKKNFRPDDTLLGTRVHYYCGMKVNTCNVIKNTGEGGPSENSGSASGGKGDGSTGPDDGDNGNPDGDNGNPDGDNGNPDGDNGNPDGDNGNPDGDNGNPDGDNG